MNTYDIIIKKLRLIIGNDHLILVILALFVGTIAGAAVIVFRESISIVQFGFYGSASERFFSNDNNSEWWQILIVPIFGGLLVGLIVQFCF